MSTGRNMSRNVNDRLEETDYDQYEEYEEQCGGGGFEKIKRRNSKPSGGHRTHRYEEDVTPERD